MSSLTVLLSVAFWIHNVQARNNTLIHGWTQEPSGRGTWSILWGCLATIFICTWSALHLDVPDRHDRWYLLFRRLGWMLIAATAPEIVVLNAAENFFNSRDLLNHLHSQGHQKWTLVHTRFAYTNGFWTRTPLGDESKCNVDRLQTLIENRDIEGPPISEDELKSRGKSDWGIKLIAMIQIIWFVVQTLVRAIQHYHITPLEIMTIAFVFCSVFTYSICLNQPQDVEYPVILEVSDAALARDGTPSTADTKTPGTYEVKPKPKPKPKQESDKSIHAEEEGETSDAPIRGDKARAAAASHYVPGWAAAIVPLTLFGIFACGFGALHCLAWNSLFPTWKEQLAWRICSVTTTAAPFVLFCVLVSLNEGLGGSLILIDLIAYVIGRITIIVLAFMSLRALPADAFQTVDWNSYIPHFAV